MDHTTILVDLLKLHFGWHLARIKCLAYIIVALFKIKTVNLTEIAPAFPGTAEIESHYKRLQRFFKQVDMYAITEPNLYVVSSHREAIALPLVHHIRGS